MPRHPGVWRSYRSLALLVALTAARSAAASDAPTRCAPGDAATFLKKGNFAAADAWLACRQRCGGDQDCVAVRTDCGGETFYNEVYKTEVERYFTQRIQTADCEQAPLRVLSPAVCAAGRCEKKPDPCAAARALLSEFLAFLPRDCATKADCEGAYIQADTCAPAVVFRKGTLADNKLKSRLELLQDTARRACPRDGPACSPQPYQIRCLLDRCEDGAP
jgi:hypothetical protein